MSLAGTPSQLHGFSGSQFRVALTRALLACGVAYAVIYVVVNDVVAASLYPGYSRVDQAVSELSAVGAPTAGLLRAMLPVFTLLMLGFGAGTWRAAGISPTLRWAACCIFVASVVGLAWLWFPMTRREDMQPGPMAANDVGHLVLSGLTVLNILLQMAFGARALRGWFRSFTGACAVLLLAAGATMSALATQVGAGPTPMMGLLERAMLGGWLGWTVVFALTLMKNRQGLERRCCR